MEIKDVLSLIRPIKNKIFLMIARAVLEQVNDSTDTQTIKAEVLKGEVLEKIERYTNYGFESYPKSDSEAIILFQNGSHDHGIAVVVHDKRYRPKLAEGESQLYDWNGSIVHLKQDKSIYIESASGSIIDMNANGDINGTAKRNINLEDGNGNTIRTNATQINMNDNLTVDI